MTQKIRTAVIPAAGLGTRFLPMSKATPKELAPVFDRPAIHYVVREAMEAGIEHIAIVISRGKESLQTYFTPSVEIERATREKASPAIADELREFARRLTFSYPIQAEQHGLGHAVLSARHVVPDGPFAVILPDDLLVSEEPALGQIVHAWEKSPGNYVAVEEVPRERISAYGIVDPALDGQVDDRTTRLKGLVEKPPADRAPSNLGIVGRYILMPAVFDALAETPPGAIGEIQLTDGIAGTLETTPLYAYRYNATRYDCGNPQGLLQASIAMALRHESAADRVRRWVKQ